LPFRRFNVAAAWVQVPLQSKVEVRVDGLFMDAGTQTSADIIMFGP
jgi:hypothetical protein